MPKYIVRITFLVNRKRTNYLVGTRLSPYPFSHGNNDTFEFDRKGFTLEATRSSIYADGTILNNEKNGLYLQIIKGLMVYYALANDYPILKSISIVRKRSRLPDIVYNETSTFSQPLKPGNHKRFYLPISFADEILQETEKSTALRIALTYWLKAMNSSETYVRFDRFWRAYDRLLLHQGNTNKEKNGIPSMKSFIRSNEGLFPRSKSITNAYDATKLRSFRWVLLLASKTMSYTKVGELNRRLTEYSDGRIMAMFSSIARDRKIMNALNSGGYLTSVNAHFTSNAGTTNDIDLVLLISLTYTYFIRCRLFHGEVIDTTFKVKETKEDYEIRDLGDLLEVVIFELLLNSSLLR